MKLINTFEEACSELGLNAATVIPDFSMYPERDRKAMEAHAKLVLIAKAANDGWEPDWANYDQRKYYPWFDYTPSSGSGFSFYDCGGAGSVSGVGSRLCFKSRELATHIGKTFEGLYRDYFVIG